MLYAGVMVEVIITGGQTGVDRAALDVALDLGIAAGGLCPRGRRAEDGRIPDRYPLTESRLSTYAWRTVVNVWRADGLLVLSHCRPGRAPTGGTGLALRSARLLRRPAYVVDLVEPEFHAEAGSADVRAWLDARNIRVLNVAGPRASKAPGIEAEVRAFMRAVLGGA